MSRRFCGVRPTGRCESRATMVRVWAARRLLATRLGLAGVALFVTGTWTGACQDGHGSMGPPPPPLADGPAIVSDPIPGAALSIPAVGPRAPSAASTVAYVSLPPDSVPGGVSAVIVNRRTGSTATTSVINGGFDPVPVPAVAGDPLEITIQVGGGNPWVFRHDVPLKHTPSLVRTSPSSGKRDVPLNTTIVIVFSEPVNASTLTSASVQLFRGTTQIPGTVGLLQGTETGVTFTPSVQLEVNTTYRLVVTRDVKDLTGDALPAVVSIDFTTGRTSFGEVVAVHVLPETTLVAVGSDAQLTAAVAVQLLPDTPNVVVITSDFGRPIIWSSDNPGVATVSPTGVVTAVDTGHTRIYALVSNRSGGADFFVTATLAPVASVDVTPVSATVPVSGGIDFAAVLKDSTGNILSYRSVSWTTSSATIARVGDVATSKAFVTGVSAGTATITASSEGVSGRAVITVVSPGAYATVSAGDEVTCALTTNNWAFCWGWNGWGQLGNGAYVGSTVPVGVAGGRTFGQVSAGVTSCALTPAGDAYCWGWNGWGGLGSGSATGPEVCASTTSSPCSSRPVAVIGGLQFANISGGSQPTCARTTNGIGYCWGLNSAFQLGVGTGTGPESCYGTPCSTRPAAIAGSLTFAAVSAGGVGACGVTIGGDAYCWGSNLYGQVGDSTTTDRSAPVLVRGGHMFDALSAGVWDACGLTAVGAAYCWGENASGQLGIGTTTGPDACSGHPCSLVPLLVSGGLQFRAITVGFAHVCALTIGGAAYCWGANGVGELGTGGPPVGSTTPALIAGGLTFASLSAGSQHTCGVTVAGVVYCWGRNYEGQLGDGSTTSSNVPVKVAGQP